MNENSGDSWVGVVIPFHHFYYLSLKLSETIFALFCCRLLSARMIGLEGRFEQFPIEIATAILFMAEIL